jgi:hypothetical protein
LEGQFFFVEITALEAQTGNTGQDDSSAFPAHLCRLMHQLIRLGCGGDENGIQSCGPAESHRHGIGTGNASCINAQPTRQSDAILIGSKPITLLLHV